MEGEVRLEHRGYFGTVEVSLEDECLCGHVLYTRDVVTYEGQTVPELVANFKAAVDGWLKMGEDVGSPVEA